MEKTIYLVRHGQASAGTHDYDRLSEIGQRQARLIGEHWRTCDLPPAAAFSGTLVRQRDTAILAESIKAEDIDDRSHHGLNEYDHKRVHANYAPEIADEKRHSITDSSGKKIDLATSTTFEQYAQIISNWRNCSAPPGSVTESWQQFKQRTLQTVIDCALTSDADTIALYTSGGAISVITAQIEQLPEADIPQRIWDMRNGSITTLNYQSGQLVLKDLNATSHLERDADPTLLTLI